MLYTHVSAAVCRQRTQAEAEAGRLAKSAAECWPDCELGVCRVRESTQRWDAFSLLGTFSLRLRLCLHVSVHMYADWVRWALRAEFEQ